MTTHETGNIKYTGRAFEQDADQAMGSDIVRALVELITNADDAYGPGTGTVSVEVLRGTAGQTVVSVSDTAKGLTPDELKACFSVLGEKTSGFNEGKVVRGLFGRGAKDTAAFGRTIFESIKSATYGRFELQRNGTWTLDSRAATDEDYRNLSIPPGGSGLRASVVIERAGITIPNRTELARRLTRHVQLRQLTNRREVTLRISNDGKRGQSSVLRWDEPSGDVLFNGDITIGPYDVTAHLLLLRLNTPSADRLDNYSSHGIVISARASSFVNTMFGETGPETAWLHGALYCPAIDDLIKNFDDDNGADPNNPSRLLRRDRDGLMAEHPFTVALTAAVLDVLSPILAEMRPKRDAVGGSAQLNEELREAGKVAAALLRNDLQRLDLEGNEGGLHPTSSSPFVMVPPQVAVRLGSRRTITVLISDLAIPADAEITAASLDPSIAGVTEMTERRPHATLTDTSILNIRIDTHRLGTTTASVGVAGESTGAACEIRVHDDPIVPDEPPHGLEWANSSMSVAQGKSRTILLRAPIELAPSGSLDASIELDGLGVELSTPEVTLSLTAKGWLEGRCGVKGAAVDATVVITASAAGERATGTIRVTRPTANSGLDVDFRIVDESQGSLRGFVRPVDTGYLVEIYARYPGLAPILGSKTKNGGWEHEHAPSARVAIAEAFASTLVDWLLRTEAAKSPFNYGDVDGMLFVRSKYVSRYLPPMVRQLAVGASSE